MTVENRKHPSASEWEDMEWKGLTANVPCILWMSSMGNIVVTAKGNSWCVFYIGIVPSPTMKALSDVSNEIYVLYVVMLNQNCFDLYVVWVIFEFIYCVGVCLVL